MALLSGSAFAREAGVSRQAVSDAAKKGFLTRRGDGKFDTTHELNSEYLKKHNQIQEADRIQKIEKPKHPARKKKVTEYNNYNAENPIMSEREYKAEKTKWDAKNSQLKAETEQGKLVERDLIQSVFNRISETVNNDLLQRGEREADMICGYLGISDPDKIIGVRKMLEKSDIRTVEAIKKDVKDFAHELKKRAREIKRGEHYD